MNTMDITLTAPALELRGIEKGFPGIRVLKDVSFACRAGEVHALMGENGAGKSTLMRIIAGIWRPDAGEIYVAGKKEHIQGPRHAHDLGIAMVHQDTRLVFDLDVARNIWLGREPGGRASIDLGKMRRDSVDLLARLGMRIDVDRQVGSLSVAERQIVEIARALTVDPSVLILDEPTSALDGAEISRLFQIVNRLKAQGTSTIFISHRLPEVFEIADRMTVLKDGEVVGTVERGKITHDGLVSMMVGRAVELAYPPRATSFGPVKLSVTNLSSDSRFSNVSFGVRAGEILGLGGIQGNGQSDVPRALFGLAPWTGAVQLNGKDAKFGSPGKAIAAGYVYVPGDRHSEGLFMPHSIRENVSLPHLEMWSGLGIVPSSRERDAAGSAIERFAVKTTGPESAVATLSGGNQQKVVLGRWTTEDPQIFVFEDPTRGVDVGTKLEIYRQIRELTKAGAAVILVASDLLELIGLSDRILVFSRGRIVDEMDGADATEERIVGGAAGAKDVEPVAQRVSGLDAHKSTGFLDRLTSSRYGSAGLLAILIILLAAAASRTSAFFLTPGNLSNIAVQIAPLGLAALGQFIVVLIRGIDLSVGPLISLTTAVVSYVAVSEGGMDITIAIAVSLAIGVGVGAVNAILVEGLKIPDLIATLSTYSVIFGLALIVRPSPGGLVSDSYLDFFAANIFGVPVAALLVLVLFLGTEFVLIKWRAGQALYATGSSPEASFVVGINTTFVRSAAYIFCGVCAALAGLLVTARIGSGDPQAGTSFTLSSVTAVVIGGASVFGGRGTALATLLGAIAVGIMQNALNLMQVSAYYQYIWTGALTLLAVSAYSLRFARQR